MKHTRLALVLAISLTATPVLAASMTMLQFGSFETREEAEKRLGEIKGKYAVQLGSLNAAVREIKLPPDNLTVYRTQAGPVGNRAAAQNICSKLASAGDECYIVQTAMLAEGEQKPTATLANNTASNLSAVSPANAAMQVTGGTTGSDTSLLTGKTVTLAEVPRDPSNREALNNVSANLSSNAPTSVTLPAASAEASPELKAAIDKAVSEQDAAASAVDKTVVAENPSSTPNRGFWSRLNPFSGSDTKPAAPAPAAVKAPQPMAAPVEAVVVEPQKPAILEPLPASQLPTRSVMEAAPPPAGITPPALAPVVIANSTPTTNNAPVITEAEPMRLPPPPAPLKAMSAADAPMMKPEPIAAAPLPPVANAVVNVEEAKRVPVTQTTVVTAPVVAVPQIIAKPVQPPAVPLPPSSTNGMKTVWAQIGPFADSDAALSFWANYRQAHPDFPVVRVRVITPYQQQVRGQNQSWVRVGPVTRAAFVDSLCSSIAQPSALRCGTITDLGVAASAQSNGQLPGSRYHR